LIDVVGKRKWFFLFSALIMVPGIVFLLVGGLRLGIDFTGGTIWEIKFVQPTKAIESQEARDVFVALGYDEVAVQTAAGDVLLVRLRELKDASPEKNALTQALEAQYGPIDQKASQLQSVGPTVGASISQRAIIAVALASAGILLYLAYAFRSAPHPFRYGVCAILAMLHDVIIVLGIFAILGYFFDIEIDALFVTALLTVIGFSVHDTIVVFDRIRENVGRRAGVDFTDIVNYSLVQTMVRSINTSLTVVFTLLALYLFGGETIKNFILALLLGIVSGTYSSIFNASLLLVVWERRELPELFDRLRGRHRPATA
jgi:preprotein translocase subunit SecF